MTGLRSSRAGRHGAGLRFGDLDVIERSPLDHDGKSGSRLERVTTSDGRVLVVKDEDPRANWIMQSTGDDGRLVRLWSSGVLGRLPGGVDCAIETVEELPSGWRVVMRDVAAALIPDGRLLTRAESRRIMAGAFSVHEAFAGAGINGLCPLVDRLAFLTPAAVRGIAAHPLGAMALTGWDRFSALAPGEVGEAVLRLLDRPGSLAAALGAYPATLLHGDLKVANVGFDDRRVVMLDWGTLTGMGRPAVEHAWHVVVNGAAVDASLDDLLADAAALLSPEDGRALPLALLGALLQLGWEKALGATSDDPAVRARERAGLAWWWERAKEALEALSPA